jgi:hypothetical protein
MQWIIYTLRHPDLPSWDLIWPRLWRPRMVAKEQDVTFRLLHNLLPVRARLARFGLAAQANCPGVLETALHVFTVCNREANTWHQLVATLLPHTGPQQDEDLLYLAWPVVARDLDITVALRLYFDQVWASRDGRRPPTFAGLTESLRLLPAFVVGDWGKNWEEKKKEEKKSLYSYNHLLIPFQ